MKEELELQIKLQLCSIIANNADKLLKEKYISTSYLAHDVNIAYRYLTEDLRSKPKFKVGDYVHPIKDRYNDGIVSVLKIEDDHYVLDTEIGKILPFEEQDMWETVN